MEPEVEGLASRVVDSLKIDISLSDDNAWLDWASPCNITLLFKWRFFIFVDVFFAWVRLKLLDLLSTLSCSRLCSAKQLCALFWRDPSICRVLFFSSSFVIRRVLCPCYDLLDVDLCVNNLSPALCKTTRYRMLPWQTSASECFLEWRLCFSEESIPIWM